MLDNTITYFFALRSVIQDEENNIKTFYITGIR